MDGQDDLPVPPPPPEGAEGEVVTDPAAAAAFAEGQGDSNAGASPSPAEGAAAPASGGNPFEGPPPAAAPSAAPVKLPDAAAVDDGEDRTVANDFNEGLLVVRVEEPQTQGTGNSQYTSYRIKTEVTNVQGWDAEHYAVVRRFRDFDWFRQQLVLASRAASRRAEQEYRRRLARASAVATGDKAAEPVSMSGLGGPFLPPPLPPKAVMSRMEEGFVQSRQRALQRFLDRIVSHSRMRNLECTRQFLTLSEGQLAQAKEALAAQRKASAQEQPEPSATGATGGISGLFNSVERAVRGGRQKPTQGATRSAEDLSFEELRAYVAGLEPIVRRAWQVVGDLATRRRAKALAEAQFGAAYRELGRSESGAVGKTLQALSKAATTEATITKRHCEGPLRWVEEDFADALRVISNFQSVFQMRDEARQELQRRLDRLEQARLNVTRLQGVAGQEQQQAAAAEAAKAAQEAVEEQRPRVQVITAALAKEVAAVRGMRLGDLRAVLVDFATAEALREQQVAAAWNAALPAVDQGAAEEEEADAARALNDPDADDEVTAAAAGGGAAAGAGDDEEPAQVAEEEEVPEPTAPAAEEPAPAEEPAGDSEPEAEPEAEPAAGEGEGEAPAAEADADEAGEQAGQEQNGGQQAAEEGED